MLFNAARKATVLFSAIFLAGSTAGIAVTHEKQPSNPLAAFSASLRAITRDVAPAVVEVLGIGYSTPDADSGKTSYAISRQRFSGSGEIVDPAGYILTNAHVVEGALTLKVVVVRPAETPTVIPDSPTETYDARIIGIDVESDIAVLKIEATGLYALRLGDPDSIAQGDIVMAIGSPMLLGIF